jgi:hypothetical protein
MSDKILYEVDRNYPLKAGININNISVHVGEVSKIKV